ncbi:MAG: hypothetical protein AB1430_16610 [Pseudomonadota bacterium]
MEPGKTLIDRVLEMRQWSRYKLCQELDVNQSFLSRIYHGEKPMPPLMAADLAALAGQDPRAAAIEAELAQAAPERRQHYAKLFQIAPVLEAATVASNDSGNEAASLEGTRAKWRKR